MFTGLNRFLFCFWEWICHRYSTEFTSVHGGRPTAEYAKLRRESLETEFGQALGAYSSKSFSAVYRFGPFLALYRAAIISFYVVKLTFWQLFVQDMRKRAVKVCILDPVMISCLQIYLFSQ